MCRALALFHTLCEAGNMVERVREECQPAGDAWTALTEVLQGLDALVDMLVESPAIEWEDE